jgi:UDP-glucose 4-epimerase
MRVGVVGADGLIGTALAQRLRLHAEVLAIGRRSAPDLRCDLIDPSSVAALDLSGLDALIHCAGVVDEDFTDPAAAFRKATAGAAALFERAVAGGVRRVAYISSAHVYGPLAGRIDEAVSPDPRSDYAIAHFATEQILKRTADAFDVCATFRPCAVFGLPVSVAGFRRWSLIPFAFPRAAISEGRIDLTSDGTQSRNFIAADDVAAAVTCWLSADAAGYGVFNPVGRSTLTVWDFARLCATVAEALTGRSVPVSRPHAGGAVAPPLDYRTVHPFCLGQADLPDGIAALTRHLLEEV